MGSVKRKGNAPEDSGPRQSKKRVKVDSEKDTKAGKKASTANGTANKDRSKKPKTETDSAPRPATVSVLRDEAPAFPRGGNNVLTPLERKQIQIQATRDVLFEQKGARDGELPDNDSDIEKEEDASKEAGVKSSNKKHKSKKNKKSAEESAKPEGPKIESLSFKVRCLSTIKAESNVTDIP